MSAPAPRAPEARLVLEAPAKINLYLEVLGRRPDGFHELLTVLQTLELCDTVALALRAPDRPPPTGRADVRLSIDTEPPARGDVPAGPENLVVRAVTRVLDEAGARADAGLDVTLTKRIPAGGGLGGGSSDAAAALLGTNALLGEPLSRDVLRRLATELGSDVPFFLEGGTCLCTGRGEHVRPLTPPHPFEVQLVLPDFGVPTPAVYAALDAPPVAHAVHADAADVASLFADASLDALEHAFRNDLTEAAARVEPRLLALLRRAGTHLSGSGSTLFRYGGTDHEDPMGTSDAPVGFVTTRSRKS